MTASTSQSQISSSAKSKPPNAAAISNAPTSQQTPSYLSFGSSAAFQQVKQTQASLARLSRVHQHQQQQQQQISQTNQSSQQIKESNSQQQSATQTKSTTFVDCLIRRFKNCFSEDFCTVPMFVVGNLSPGSDGTHLILPPCVSLGRQNINRFACPKNLRLMNSIRESCRSIEELDLGGNKLNDLIEVYKILQCTPNLKFLNLSENDLSRTSPVAMAAACTTSIASSSPPSSSSYSTPVNLTAAQQHWSSSSVAISQRNFLTPINQNQHAIGARRHSALGQPIVAPPSAIISSQRARQAGSRVAEARRLAAAAALAQSKKTSSSVASKLASSARQATNSRAVVDGVDRDDVLHTDKTTRLTVGQRHQAATTSTMSLARSLSSLFAKDVRDTGSSLGRLSSHRTSGRKDNNLKSSSNQLQRQRQQQQQQQQQRPKAIVNQTQQIMTGNKQQQIITNKTKLGSTHKLFVEPIAETDDVDMGGEQQVSQANNNNRDIVQQPTVLQQSTRALALQTGNTITRSVVNSPSVANPSTSSQSSLNFRRTFESIKALALNNTRCQWRVVCSILSRMPNLEELHLSLNNYQRIDLGTNEFKHHSLKRLYLCNNPKLTNWEELDKLLIAFPSLEALSIADCNISQIPDNLAKAREWQKLCGLNINGWPIKEWPVIERLNQLPSLIDLKCRNLEILQTIDEPRHHLIARLPKLQRLNGSEIEEREHAEKAFLRFFMVNSHLERPSRFHELVQIHGEVIPVEVDVDLSPPSQAHVRVIYLNRNHYRNKNEDDIFMSEDFLIKLMGNIECPNVIQQNNLENMEVADVMTSLSTNTADDSQAEGGDNDNKLVRLYQDEGQEVLAIDVDLRQSVRKFKSTLASLFGLNSQNMILYYIDHEMVGLMGPELIKHNQKKLWNYNVQDGDQFIVEER